MLSFFVAKVESKQSKKMSSSDFSNTQMSDRATRQSFLLTYSRADLTRFPTREGFAQAVVEAFNSGNARAKVDYWVCAREPHELTTGFHYHMAVRMSHPKRWNMVKRLLVENHGIVVNFSTTHNMYYYAYRYVTKTDSDFIRSDGHPPLETIGSPKTKKCVAESRRSSIARAEASPSTSTTQHSESTASHQPQQRNSSAKCPRLDKFAVSKFIRKENIKDGDHLYNVAEQRSLAGNDDLARFCVSQARKSIDELFDSTHRLSHAKAPVERLERPRMDVIRETWRGDCVEGCSQQWIKCALEVLENNRIDYVDFAFAIRDLLIRGRGKRRNILIIGEADCAKTFLLDPLRQIFNTYTNPGNNKYTWQDAEDCSVIFLNDFRWSQDIISWSDLLLLLEGQPVRFPAPKNHRAKDILFTRDVPIFATGEGEIKYAGAYSRGNDRENEMMRVRWKIFNLFYRIPKEEIIEMAPCPRCFANLVLLGEPDV